MTQRYISKEFIRTRTCWLRKQNIASTNFLSYKMISLRNKFSSAIKPRNRNLHSLLGFPRPLIIPQSRRRCQHHYNGWPVQSSGFIYARTSGKLKSKRPSRSEGHDRLEFSQRHYCFANSFGLVCESVLDPCSVDTYVPSFSEHLSSPHLIRICDRD